MESWSWPWNISHFHGLLRSGFQIVAKPFLRVFNSQLAWEPLWVVSEWNAHVIGPSLFLYIPPMISPLLWPSCHMSGKLIKLFDTKIQFSCSNFWWILRITATVGILLLQILSHIYSSSAANFTMQHQHDWVRFQLIPSRTWPARIQSNLWVKSEISQKK